VAGIVNGFILLLMVGQAVLATVRIAAGRSRQSDWFLWAASLGLLAIELLVGSFTTTAPELEVAALTLVLAWCMLAGNEEAKADGSLSVPVLACGALIAKLSGLLLLPVSILFAIVARDRWRLLTTSALTAALATPVFLASIVTVGCLAVIAAASCLPLRWTIPLDTVERFSQALWEWSRWGGYRPPNAGAWDWVPGWLSHWFNIIVLAPFVLALAGFLAIAATGLTRGERWVLALILPDIALVLATAPDLRFNYALFITPAALLMARLGPMALPRSPKRFIVPLANPLLPAALLGVLMVTSAVAIEAHQGLALTPDRIVRARAAPTIAVGAHRQDGLDYVIPEVGTACWNAPLPCSDRELHGIRLLAPERGLAGGFFQAH
jgi:hypothetical protein